MEPGMGHLVGGGIPFLTQALLKNTQLPPCTGPRGSWGIEMLFHRVFFFYKFTSLVQPEEYLTSYKSWTSRAQRSFFFFFPVLLCLAPLPLLANCILIHVLASALPTQWPPINMSITI